MKNLVFLLFIFKKILLSQSILIYLIFTAGFSFCFSLAANAQTTTELSQYTSQCRESGNPSARATCYPVEAPYIYQGGSYNYQVGVYNQPSEQALVEGLLAGVAPYSCTEPSLIWEGGWSDYGVYPEKNQSRSFRFVVGVPEGNNTCNVITGSPNGNAAYRNKNYTCPIGDVGPILGPGYKWFCAHIESDCTSTPHPVSISDGHKFFKRVSDGDVLDKFRFARFYSSYKAYNRTSNSNPLMSSTLQPGWLNTFDASIHIGFDAAGLKPIYTVIIPGDMPRPFLLNDGAFLNLQRDGTRLSTDTSGKLFFARNSDDFYEFSSVGQLLAISDNTGRQIEITYNSENKIDFLRNFHDRKLQFIYDSSQRLAKLIDPSGEEYTFSYDSKNHLTSVIYPTLSGGSQNSIVYHYENINFPDFITGITDENGSRFETFIYDGQGRVRQTFRHASATQSAENYSITYENNGTRTVIEPSGASRTYAFTTVNGVSRVKSASIPCASGCGTASATTYDTNGNVSSKTNFNGNTSCFKYDLSRNLEIARVEGLAPGKSCPSDVAAYTPVATTSERKITTQWHATYRLPTLITEPGKTTAFTYDAAGNLLSKTLTDTALNTSRTWSWTYNSLGQVLTADGPRTDVSDVTTYTYYTSASSVAGSVHSIGDLATVTNAVGHVTSITHYDLNGRPLSITDANGVVTTLTYAPRGWLTSRTVNGVQTTTYAYDGVGQLIQVTLPDNSALKYSYDTAHRLTDIEQGYVSGGSFVASGNKIHYTLDAMGNRLKEDTQDPSNAILKTRSRVFDALNRLQKDIGGTSPTTQITQYGYDNNGNLNTITDPLNRVTTHGYDALNRLITVTDPANGVSTTTYNALDQVTSVSDPRLVTTNYTINALGNVTLTQSPDSGNTAQVYDAAGNVIQKTDARGVVSTYTYDALNRLTGITYPANPAENVTFAYDDTSATYYRKGRLTYVLANNNSSILGFVYDPYGNIAQQVDLSATTWATSTYQYDSANRLKQITYPSGRIVTYTRNALGQITQVHTLDNANAAAQTIISNAAYKPFGPLTSLSFGNGVTTAIQHDADYRIARITTTSTPGWDYVYGYDAAGNLTGMSDQLGSASKSYGYDSLDRVNAEQVGGLGNYSYQYDAGGNRTVLSIGPYSLAQTYAASSNRMTAFAANSTPSDNAGNLTARLTIGAMSYNNANRLSQTTVNSTVTNYQYTGLGWRNGKLGAQTVHYDYLPDGKTLSQMHLNANNSYNQGFDYIWLDDLPIAQIKTTYTTNNTAGARKLTYIHADHLNTPRIMTDANKTVVWKWHADAYGLVAPNENPDGDSISDRLDLRFAGQVYDQESGLFYNMYRYYDPLRGGYTQSDPIGLEGGLNTYAYVNGNPISNIDPLGLQTIAPVMPLLRPMAMPKPMAFPIDPAIPFPNYFKPPLSEEEREFCRKERRACAKTCEKAMDDPDQCNVYGGSIERCIRGCLPYICGGNAT